MEREQVSYEGCLLIQGKVVAKAVEHNTSGWCWVVVAKNIVAEVAISGQQQYVLAYGSIKDGKIR